MLPDGRCGLVAKKRKRKKIPSIEEEALRLETEYAKIRNKLKRLGSELERLE